MGVKMYSKVVGGGGEDGGEVLAQKQEDEP